MCPDTRSFLVRRGVIDVFELGAIGLAPEFAVDFVDSDEVYVYGINIEWEF